MVGRLVTDALWRNRWFYVFVGVILLPFWLLFGVSRANSLPIGVTALSLSVAVLLGPMVVIATMGLRELRHLPITHRELWRATWILGTVVPSGLLLATKTMSLILAGTPRVSLEAILLSAVYDFTWAAVALRLFHLLGYARHARGGGVATSFAHAVPVVAVLICFGLPVVVGDDLPTRVAAFTPTAIGMLIAGLAIALGGLAWTPPRGVVTGHSPKPHISFVSPRAAGRFANRLTGISRVLVPHLLTTLALPVGACLALAAYGVIAGSGPWWFVPPRPEMFDPEDIGYRGLTFFVLLPCGVVTGLGLWPQWTRLLKVLPLSVKQINALLLLTPFATWTVLWLLGRSAYALVYGAPRSSGIAFLFGMAATGALAHAVLLRVQGSIGLVWVLCAIGSLMPQWVKVGVHGGTVAQVMFVVIGALALCTAAYVNHRTLTRSTSSSLAYRRPQAPFGFPAKPGVR